MNTKLQSDYLMCIFSKLVGKFAFRCWNAGKDCFFALLPCPYLKAHPATEEDYLHTSCCFSTKAFLGEVAVSTGENRLSSTPTNSLNCPLYAFVNTFVTCTITLFIPRCLVVEGPVYYGGPLSNTGNTAIWFPLSRFPERSAMKDEMKQ